MVIGKHINTGNKLTLPCDRMTGFPPRWGTVASPRPRQGPPLLPSTTTAERAVSAKYLGTHNMYNQNIDGLQLNTFLKGDCCHQFPRLQVSSPENWRWNVIVQQRMGFLPSSVCTETLDQEGKNLPGLCKDPLRQLGSSFKFSSKSTTTLCFELLHLSWARCGWTSQSRTKWEQDTETESGVNITGIWVAWTIKTTLQLQQG